MRSLRGYLRVCENMSEALGGGDDAHQAELKKAELLAKVSQMTGQPQCRPGLLQGEGGGAHVSSAQERAT